jgi:CRISPR-associated protein Cmr5
MRKIEKLLAKADSALTKAYQRNGKDVRIVDEKGETEKVFNSYIASFPASVIQSGLVPALAFYCGEAASEGDRSLIIEAIAAMLLEKDPEKYKNFTSAQAMFKSCVVSYDRAEQEDIINASIALKLMIRTYKIKEKKAKNDKS